MGTTADSDLENQLVNDWFSIGGKWGAGIGNGTDFWSDNSASVPYLQVQWTGEAPKIQFENPTPSIEVSSDLIVPFSNSER